MNINISHKHKNPTQEKWWRITCKIRVCSHMWPRSDSPAAFLLTPDTHSHPLHMWDPVERLNQVAFRMTYEQDRWTDGCLSDWPASCQDRGNEMRLTSSSRFLRSDMDCCCMSSAVLSMKYRMPLNRLNHNCWNGWPLIIWAISLEWNGWLQRYLFYCLNFCLKRRHSGVELIYLVCNIRRWATVLYGIDIIFVNFDLEQSWLKLDKTLSRFKMLN